MSMDKSEAHTLIHVPQGPLDSDHTAHIVMRWQVRLSYLIDQSLTNDSDVMSQQSSTVFVWFYCLVGLAGSQSVLLWRTPHYIESAPDLLHQYILEHYCGDSLLHLHVRAFISFRA